MESKNHTPQQPRIITVNWDHVNDPTSHWDPDLIQALQGLIAQLYADAEWYNDQEDLDFIPDPSADLAMLEDMDATVHGDHHPQALNWILNARA